jgi:iron complex transport system ATP-binding protein
LCGKTQHATNNTKILCFNPTVDNSKKLTVMLLTIQNLAWSVKQNNKQKNILLPLSLQLTAGEMVGIIGPNGAGKTSLIQCILQQITSYQGDIFFQNINIKHLSRQYLAQHIAVVSQRNESVFKLTVYDVVRMGLMPHKRLFSFDNKQDKHLINDALQKTDLTSLAQQNFHALSGGEQQRVLIARALVQKAKLLILDEPTNHLDVYYQHQILQLISDLKLTVLMSIHDLNLASQYCPRILLLSQGKLLADGKSSSVLQPELLTKVFGLPCKTLADPYDCIDKVQFYPKQHSHVSYQEKSDE